MANRPPTTSSEIIDNVKKGKDKIIQVYEMLPNFCLPEETSDLLNDLRESMKSYVLLETKYNDVRTCKEKVTQHFMQKITENSENSIVLDEINETFKSTLTKEMEKHSEDFWERDPLYKSMKDFAEQEDNASQNQEMTSDDELAVTGVSVQTIDPYSKKEFSDPVKNIHCKHSYERSIIIGLIQSNPKVRCYWMGCNNRMAIKAQDLVPDEELKRHMTRLKARAAM